MHHPSASLGTLEHAKFALTPGRTTEEQEAAVRVFQDQHQEASLAAVTNGADGGYDYFIDMDGFNMAAVQGILDGGTGTVTITFEATLLDDGTPAALVPAADWLDITLAEFGVASFATPVAGALSDIWIFDRPSPFKYLKVHVVAATGGANDADWTLRYKKIG